MVSKWNDVGLINFANHLADIATEISRKYFRYDANRDDLRLLKSDDTPVTIADRIIEEQLRLAIGNKFPDHRIIGEEFDNIDNISDYCWVIDPIDGTSSFVIGKPLFTNLISLLYKGKPVVGIINQPILGERWVAIDGQGCLLYEGICEHENTLDIGGSNLNDRKVKRVFCNEKVEVLDQAILCTTSPNLFNENDLQKLNKIAACTRYQAYGGVLMGGDSYNYALAASGLIDIVIDVDLKVYDYMAVIPVIQEAGGIICDWNGKDLDMSSDGRIVICANRAVYNNIKDFLQD